MDDVLRDFPFRGVLSLEPLIRYARNMRDSDGPGIPAIDKAFWERLEKVGEIHGPIEDPRLLENYSDLVRHLMSLVFPPVFWESEPVAAVVPFSVRPIHVSPLFKKLFLDEKGGLKGRINLEGVTFDKGRVIRAYLFILRKFYGIELRLDYPVIRTITDPETGMERHFKLEMDFRFVDARALKNPRELTDQDRAFVLEHITEPDKLKELLPPVDFELHGFTVIWAVDVTETQVLSGLQRDLIDQESLTSPGGFMKIQDRLRTFFGRPGLVASVAAIQDEEVLLLNTGCDMTRKCIFADSRHVRVDEFRGSVFEKAVKSGRVTRVADLEEEQWPREWEKGILDGGVRSLMVAPLHAKGECIGTLDVGTPEPGDLEPFDELSMAQLQPIFSMALKKSLDELDHQVQGVIKQECTAIHPTVEWAFRKSALNHLQNLRLGRPSEMEPIVFKNVYPLFGVSDIRGSSIERNRAVGNDMEEHLRLALDVFSAANEVRPMLVLQEVAGRIHRYLENIRSGPGTGDEFSVAKFLRDDVEPLFAHLEPLGLKVDRALEVYKSRVDPKMGTVYSLRRDFENSVSLLNDTLMAYLDREEAEIQDLFPHYFERHRTDGVDYLIYTGSSLVEDGRFNELFLKELRLWQIRVACGLAWHTEQLKSRLKVPLDTAHLILVQSAPLSIRFRFDEKRFDVDGAYDARQEIIKSRLDKAVTRGGRERLTQPGKIALVYSHSEEAAEIRRHVEFLGSQGFLTGSPEDLDLEDLPGVQGLRALRVEVNLESENLSERAAMAAG